jgi:hypothetical protein
MLLRYPTIDQCREPSTRIAIATDRHKTESLPSSRKAGNMSTFPYLTEVSQKVHAPSESPRRLLRGIIDHERKVKKLASK